MISDVLLETVEDIEAYRRKFPAVYEGVEDELDELVEHLDQVRRLLDAPPAGEGGYADAED